MITSEMSEVAPARAKLKQVMEAKKKGKGDTPMKNDKQAPELPKIQRVPVVLREKDQENFEKNYKPRWVSIGPIHHGDPKLKLAEDRYKLELVAKFIQDSGHETDEDLYKMIKEKIQELKKCFHEEVIKDYNDESLGSMLFLDGCFMLQFIHSFKSGELKPLFKIKNDQIVFAQNDFFLLENQIPFSVLKLLMDSRKGGGDGKLEDSIKHFIRLNVMRPQKHRRSLKVEIGDQAPAHLLDLLRLTLLQNSNKVKVNEGDQQQCLSIDVRPPEAVVDQKRSRLVTTGFDSTPTEARDNQNGDHEQQSFCSVRDLRAAGITFKPSKTCSLRDIKFSSLGFAAQLELPPLVVDDSMAPKFLILIAYEICPDNTETAYEITSYICFMESLIDYPNDVKELRSANIVHNLLGSDDEVAKLFNEIGKDLVPNPEVYKKVISQIEKHYKNKCMTWIAQVFDDHFSSPWTIVASLAAVLALVMSGIQTWFTVYPRS